MLKVIIGFLPWILYFILIGINLHNDKTALVVALSSLFIFNFNELKKRFIFAWATCIFFLIMLIASHFSMSFWLETHANFLANSGLTFIAFLSLIINKPFTLQYAREITPKELWKSSIFIRINQVITSVWAMSFLMGTIISLIQLNFPLLNNWYYQIISYAPIVFAVYFTQYFPDYYNKHSLNQAIQRSEQSLKYNDFLKGNFAPVTDEIFVENLDIEGQIPDDLVGIYMRNGPNPAFKPFSYTYPFDGDGMLHAMYIKNGKACYKNKFVETDQLQVERRLKKSIYGGIGLPLIRDNKLLNPGDPTIPVKLGRFIHIIHHAGHYIALHEAAPAYEVDKKLNTIGLWNPSLEQYPISVNAHTRLDPETGELFFISYHDEPLITFHILNKQSKITKSGTINVPYSCMIHDFVITANFVVIFLCSVTVDFTAISEGRDFASWQPGLGTRIMLLSRHTYEITWIETEAFFTYHFANAFEAEDQIIIDYVRYSKFSMLTQDLPPANIYRTTLDIKNKNYIHQKISGLDVEFPRINENYNSKPYRYIYTSGSSNNSCGNERFNTIYKHDLNTGNITAHYFGDDIEVGEAVFTPKLNCNKEDDGYLMLFIYNKKENKSYFVILNAESLSENILASITLPRRIPYGLHGSWMAGEWE